MQLIVDSFLNFEMFMSCFVVMMEVGIAVDLVLTLRNPFANGAHRTPKWLFLATLYALLLTCIRVIFDEKSQDNTAEIVISYFNKLLFFSIYPPALVYLIWSF